MWLRGKRKAARLAKVHWQAQHLTDERHDKRRGRDCCRLTGRGGPGEIKGGQVSLGATALLVHGGKLYSSLYTALFNWQLRTRRPYDGVSFCCRSRWHVITVVVFPSPTRYVVLKNISLARYAVRLKHVFGQS